MKKKYILDTSVYLTNANAVFAYGNNDIIVPLIVLEEIDKQKKRQDIVGANARKIVRTLDSLRERGNLNNGVRIAKGKGIISVQNFRKGVLPSSYEIRIPDNKIIATALTEKEKDPKRKVILVSRDINMRVKCDAIGLQTESYLDEHVVKTIEHVYDGITSYLVDDEMIDRFYDGEKFTPEEDEIELFPNQFVMLVSNSNEKKTALAKFKNYNTPLLKINGDSKRNLWNIKPRNKEQTFAVNLLADSNVKIVTLVGKAGSGKTLCAIAAGLEQVLEPPHQYRRLIVTRPIQPLGKDIGYLPGTMEEKMTPWLGPIDDNLRFLMSNDNAMLTQYVDKGLIEIEALTYIRGRSISNAFIVVDEAQNLTNHELKTIITRVGEDTKIVLTGDIEQIDNTYINETTNGLTYAVEKFKKEDLAGHIILQKGERSKVASLAAKLL